jgi:hypothetical protein
MRGFMFAVGLTALAVGSNGVAMTAPSEQVIAEGKIVNVDEKNLSFDVREASGRQSSHRVHSPICVVMRADEVLPYKATWDDLRKLSLSGRIVTLSVDPSNPNVVYVGGSRW